MTRRSRLGSTGEDLAAEVLRAAGVTLLARNWRPSGGELRGELDLVGRVDTTLVVCEVKARQGADIESALLAVTERKQYRVRLLARRFMQESGVRPRAVRFDVIGLHWDLDAAAPRIVHIEGAF